MRRFAFIVLFAPALAFAHQGIAVSNGWAPPSLSQANAVGFLTLNAADDDALVSATSDCCKAVELHAHIEEGDVVRMRRIARIPLPDHQDVMLAPGGYHLMLIGLKQPLKEGMKIPLTLHFEHAKEVTTVLEVDRGRLLQQLKTPLHSHTH